MNKRSAMLMAAGLVFTLLVGGVAIAIGLTGPAASAAAPRVIVRHKAPKPIVKTIKKTITVHKKAPQSSGGGTISYSAPPAPAWTSAPVSQVAYSSSAPTSGYHDDGGHDGGTANGGGGGDD